MQERRKVQALDPVCGIWLSAKIISVEESGVTVKWVGYEQKAQLSLEKVRKPVLKRMFKLSKEHWTRMDPRSLQRGDKVIHVQPSGEDGDMLVIEENDSWNGKIKVGNRFYLEEHLCEARESEKGQHYTAAGNDENIPPPSQQMMSNSKKAARPLATAEPCKDVNPAPLTQQEKEQLEGTRPRDLENCSPTVLIKYGLAAIDALDDDANEIEEMPPPLSPLSPQKQDLDKIDLRTVVELLQSSFEEEQRKRREMEGKLHAVEQKLQQVLHAKLVQSDITHHSEKHSGQQEPVTPQFSQTPPPQVPQTEAPQNPVMTTPHTTMEENNQHHTDMQKIFASVLDSPVVSDGTVLHYSLKPEVLRELTWFSQSPQAMAREVMRKVFTPFELAKCNVRGIRKPPLDPVRVETVRNVVFQLCIVPSHLQMMVWKNCVKSMDQANRNARKLQLL